MVGGKSHDKACHCAPMENVPNLCNRLFGRLITCSNIHGRFFLLPTLLFRKYETYINMHVFQDPMDPGIVPKPAVKMSPQSQRSMYAYVSDRRKEEIFRLHQLQPEVFDLTSLSYLFNISKARTKAIIDVSTCRLFLFVWKFRSHRQTCNYRFL